MKTYGKTIGRMFKANLLRLVSISLIVSVGICIVTGISAIPEQIRDSLVMPAAGGLSPDVIAELNTVSDKVELLGLVLPVFFIVVSALSVITAITRLIEEERSAAACLKTLGYSNASIVFRHVLFAFVCAAGGCILGLAFGNFLLREIIFIATKAKYGVPDTKRVLYLSRGLIWSAAMSAAVILAAFATALRRCLEKPAVLLRPKAPKEGKKIFLEYVPLIWKRLKFKFKSSVRNIFRFKTRLVMTVFSVAGSTAIVFCGLGLFSSLNDSRNQAAGLTESLSMVAVAIILCAVALTALVLFNLTNINIEERKREIATLKVCGYRKTEVTGYIYREVFVLAVIGIVLGLPSGYFFTGFVFDYVGFGSLDIIEWYIWLSTAAIAFLSVLAADALLYRKIVKIDMLSSLKTIE